MSLQVRVADQVLDVADHRAATEARVHKYDAFLNLLCDGKYAFQRDAVRAAWRFLVSDQYPDLASLARANWASRRRKRSASAMAAWTPCLPGCRCRTRKRPRSTWPPAQARATSCTPWPRSRSPRGWPTGSWCCARR